MQSVDGIKANSKNSVLPSFSSIVLGCFILSGHAVHNIPNAYSVERQASTGIDMSCVNKFGSVFPFCLGETTSDTDGVDYEIPLEVIACLGLPLIVLQLKKLSKGASSKGPCAQCDAPHGPSVLPNIYSSALACVILCAHLLFNLPNAQPILHNLAPILHNLLVLGVVILSGWNVMESMSGAGKEDQNSILPNRYSSVLVGAVFCAHAAYNSGHLATIWKACPPVAFGLLALSLIVVVVQNLIKEQKSVLPKMPSLLLICGIISIHAVNNMETSTDVVSGSKALPPAALAMLALAFLAVVAQNLKTDQKSVLPKLPSLVLIFGTMCAHVAYNAEENVSIMVGSKTVPSMGLAALALSFIIVAAQNLMSKENSVLPKLPSLLLVCATMCTHVFYNMEYTPSTSSASRTVPQTAFAVLAISGLVVALQNLFTEQRSVLPKCHSLLLVCGIMCAHAVHNTQNWSGMFTGSILPDSDKVPLPNDMIKMLAILTFAAVVQIVVQQSSSVDKKGKTSVLPNAYSSVIICGIFCTHFAHHFAGVPTLDGLDVKSMASMISMEGVGEVLSYMGFPIFSMFVTASRMRSTGTDKNRKLSVLPNLWSIMLISWVLYFHVIHTQVAITDSASPDANVGSILGASSGLQGFGHKEHGSIENIPVEVEVGASVVEHYHAASPKAIAASILFAFIGMSLKMGGENKDKKSKKSLLPNNRSLLLISLVLLGHAVHNWPGSSSQDVHQASDYTGVDELASWDESGPVLPDTAEDLDNLLGVSPDVFGEPSIMLTSR